ncbi:hypothetical protein TcWFU_002443 [Taenia crassiceps]|uniref:Uncharacterized protein n=1 Tax=Taenia crassiceps TaxID=6207 RepID=A0ABR4Q2S4_9CEST
MTLFCSVRDAKSDDTEAGQPINRTEATSTLDTAETASAPGYDQLLEESTEEELSDQTEVDDTRKLQDLTTETERRSSTLVAVEECSNAKHMKGLTPDGTCKEGAMELGEAAVTLDSEGGEEETQMVHDNVPTLSDELYEGIEGEAQKVEGSGERVGTVSGEAVEEANGMTTGASEAAAVPAEDRHHMATTGEDQAGSETDSEWENVVEEGQEGTATEPVMEATPDYGEPPQDIGNEARESQEGEVSGEAVQEAKVATGRDSEEAVIPSDGEHHGGITNEGPDGALSASKSGGKAEATQDMVAAASEVEAIPIVGESQNTIGTSTTTEKEGGGVDCEESYQVGDAAPEAEWREVVEEAKEGTTKESEIEAIPSATRSEQEEELAVRSAARDSRLEGEKVWEEPQNEELSANATDRQTAAEEEENKDQSQEALEGGQDGAQSEPQLEGTVEEMNESATTEPEVEALPDVDATEQTEKFDTQFAEEVPETTEGSLGDARQENSALPDIETQSQGLSNEALGVDEPGGPITVCREEDGGEKHHPEVTSEGQGDSQCVCRLGGTLEEDELGDGKWHCLEAIPPVSQNEQEKERDGQLASEESRLAEDSLGDVEQENTASTVIETQSNECYQDAPAEGQDEPRCELKLAKMAEPDMEAIPLVDDEDHPNNVGKDHALSTEGGGARDEVDEAGQEDEVVKQEEFEGQSKERLMSEVNLELSGTNDDNPHREAESDERPLMEGTHGSTGDVCETAGMESALTAAEELTGVDEDGTLAEQANDQTAVEAASEVWGHPHSMERDHALSDKADEEAKDEVEADQGAKEHWDACAEAGPDNQALVEDTQGSAIGVCETAENGSAPTMEETTDAEGSGNGMEGEGCEAEPPGQVSEKAEMSELQKETPSEDQSANFVEDEPMKEPERAADEGGFEVEEEPDRETGSSGRGLYPNPPDQ